MIQVVNKQHTEGQNAGKWDIYVHDRSTEGDLLLFSNQGYENRLEAERIVERLFAQPRLVVGAGGGGSGGGGASGGGSGSGGGSSSSATVGSPAEPVDLLTLKADGTGSHRMIR